MGLWCCLDVAAVLRFIIVEPVSTWLVGYVCGVVESVLIIVECISVRV